MSIEKTSTNDIKNSITKNSTQKNTKTASNKTDPEIRLSNTEIHPGVNKTFLALLPEDATGTASFKIASTTIAKNIAVEDGMVTYTYTIPSTYNKENYTYYLIYSGDDKYNSKTVNATLTLTPLGGKVNATMSMNNITTKYQKTVQLKVNVNKNATGNVIFTIDGKQIAKAKVSNGVATANYTVKIEPSNKTIVATYNGDFQYLQTSINSTLKINPLSTNITTKNMTSKAGQLTLFTANITDENTNPVKDVNVEFRLNGKSIGYNTTNTNGTVTLYYTLNSTLYTQNNTVTIRANTTSTTKASSKTINLTLKQLKTTTSIPNKSDKPSKTVIVQAIVTDEFNNFVSNGTVTFKNGSKVLETVELKDGHAEMSYTLNYESGNFTISAYYNGDWKYGNSNGKGVVKITQLKTVLLSSAPDAKPNSEITINATLRDQYQNPVIDGQVRFTVNNKVIGTVNVSSGSASIKYSLKNLTVGNYRIVTDYLGSKIYKKNSINSTLTVKRYQTTLKGSSLNAMVGSNCEISVSVTDEEKYKVDQGTVKFYVQGGYIGSVKVKDGVASINYKVDSKYDGKIIRYIAIYEQNALYESTSCTSTITVSHQKIVYVSPNGSDSNLGDRLHPYKTLAYAVNHTSLFGTIKLREGTYSASNIALNNSITIIGAGKDKTIITGSNTGNPIFNLTKRNTVVTIKGVTIKNGKSTGEFSAGAIVSIGKLNVIFSRFESNTASGNFSGGAIYSSGILNLTNCEFTKNSVTNINSQGGAIRCYNNTTYITSCNFNNNKITGTNSTGGAIIYNEHGDLIMNRTTVVNNTATGCYLTGGLIRTAYGAVVIDGCAFKNNTFRATDYAVGGVIGSMSSGVSIHNTNINTNKIIANNTAGGCVVYIEAAACVIKNSRLNANNLTALQTYGSVLYSYHSAVEFESNQVNENYQNAGYAGFGGALYVINGNLTINKSNFTANKIKAKNISLAGVLYAKANVTISNSNFIKNSINATNLGGGAIANNYKLEITNSNFINNYAYNCGDAITSTNTATNDVDGNYWGSNKPEWSKLLYAVETPASYSTVKINN